MTIHVRPEVRDRIREQAFGISIDIETELARALVWHLSRSRACSGPTETVWTGQIFEKTDGFRYPGSWLDLVHDISNDTWHVVLAGVVAEALFEQWEREFRARPMVRVEYIVQR